MISRLLRRCILVGLTLAPCLPAHAQQSGASLVLRGATVIPDPSSPPIPDAVVVVRDGVITGVGPASGISLPPGVPVLDVSGLTLTAGFWNSHVHLAGENWAGADTASAARLGLAVREMLTRWGFTTVFDTGSLLENSLAVRRRIEAGDVPGPRVFTTGDIIFPEDGSSRVQVASAEQADAASLRLLDGGADALKVYAQAFWDLELVLPPSVLDAVVARAHERGVQVFAHPSNTIGLHNAVNAGVDVIVHTTPQIGPWGESLVAKMRAADIALIPTLKLWRFELERENVPPAGIDAFMGRAVLQLREYHRAGGTILFGTDVGYMTDFDTTEELEKMAEAGMSWSDILASLTTAPARQHGRPTSGRIAAGYEGDIVVLNSDPRMNVRAFADIAHTIRAGRIIYSR
jgi:imidazolonepropionase-like amidohydrolase